MVYTLPSLGKLRTQQSENFCSALRNSSRPLLTEILNLHNTRKGGSIDTRLGGLLNLRKYENKIYLLSYYYKTRLQHAFSKFISRPIDTFQ
jgi:hypothetical protein